MDNPDKVETITLECCPCTGVPLKESDVLDTIVRQVFDLPEQKLEVTEYRALVYEVPGSGVKVRGEFPQGVLAPQQYGFRFQAWLVYLVDYQLIPLGRVSGMCEDLFRIQCQRENNRLSQGTLRGQSGRVYGSYRS